MKAENLLSGIFMTLDWNEEISHLEKEMREFSHDLEVANSMNIRFNQQKYKEKLALQSKDTEEKPLKKYVSHPISSLFSRLKLVDDAPTPKPISEFVAFDEYTNEHISFPVYRESEAGLADKEYHDFLAGVPEGRQHDDDCPTVNSTLDWAVNLVTSYLPHVEPLLAEIPTDRMQRLLRLRKRFFAFVTPTNKPNPAVLEEEQWKLARLTADHTQQQQLQQIQQAPLVKLATTASTHPANQLIARLPRQQPPPTATHQVIPQQRIPPFAAAPGNAPPVGATRPQQPPTGQPQPPPDAPPLLALDKLGYPVQPLGYAEGSKAPTNRLHENDHANNALSALNRLHRAANFAHA